jgi:hypothetical protein
MDPCIITIELFVTIVLILHCFFHTHLVQDFFEFFQSRAPPLMFSL